MSEGTADKVFKVAGGVVFGALATGLVSMLMFTARVTALEQRVETLEQTQDRATGATEKLTDATHELTTEVRLLRQRLDRLDPPGGR